uniref:Uncharacterized protein n=1 Tax=viral metagenome TaxID=1070528 RepID=A0A6C0KS75_9ZZZZ
MLFTALTAAAGNKTKSLNNVVNRLFYTYQGQTLISAIFGIALAFLFQKVCKGDKCILIDAPDPDEINNNIYELEGVCYKYKTRSVHCNT